MIMNKPRVTRHSYNNLGGGSNEPFIFSGFAWIILITLVLYVVCVPFSILTYGANDPAGDNGTFIEVYAYLVSQIRAGLDMDWRQFVGVGQPAQTQRFLLNVLSPILTTQPHSLMLINFAAFMMAAMTIYYMAIRAGRTTAVGLICSLIPWAYPSMFGSAPVGPAGYFAFTSLNIDVIFYSAIVAFGAATALFAERPWERRRLGLLVVVMLAAMLSRQSAIITALLVLLPGMLAAAIVISRNKDGRQTFRAVAHVAATIIFAGAVISQRFDIMTNYYSAAFKSNALGSFKWESMAASIGDYRFIVDWLVQGTFTQKYYLTIAANVVILSALYALWRYIRNRNNHAENVVAAVMALSGASLFYGTYSAGILSGVRVWFHSYHGFLPMLAGLSLSAIAIVLTVSKAWRPGRGRSMLVCAAVSATFIVNAYWMEKTTANVVHTGARLSDIGNFATSLDFDRYDQKIAWLWYGDINRSVINYHRAQAGLPRIFEMPMPEDVRGAIWVGGTGELDVILQRFGAALDYLFGHAEYLVIPEHPILYHLDPGPYPFRLYPEVLIQKLNARGGPRLLVCQRLRSARAGVPYYMLLTQIVRDGIEPCSSEPLPLPYGLAVPKEEIRLKKLPIRMIELLENSMDYYRIRLRDDNGRRRQYKVPKNFFSADIFSPALADIFPEVKEIVK